MPFATEPQDQPQSLEDFADFLRHIFTPTEIASLGVELLKGLLQSVPADINIADGAHYAAGYSEGRKRGREESAAFAERLAQRSRSKWEH